MKRIASLLVLGLLVSAPAFAQSNPCNPCGGKAANACNPCGAKVAVNPCYAKMGTVFYVNDPMGRNAVSFKSQAPLEDIVGTTSQITGYLVFDAKNPKKGGRGEFVIPVSSLNTGIPLRDEHLQSKDWLNADTYPNLTLKITDVTRVKEVKSTAGAQTYDVSLRAQLSIAGKSLRMEIPGRITYLKESEKTRARMQGNLLAARASFEVDLSAFGITGPQGMNLVGSKVGESIALDISLMATSANPMMAAQNPCNPCGGKATNACNPCGGKATNPCNPCGR
jgi:polyisoprenoid-binding protein YceI